MPAPEEHEEEGRQPARLGDARPAQPPLHPRDQGQGGEEPEDPVGEERPAAHEPGEPAHGPPLEVDELGPAVRGRLELVAEQEGAVLRLLRVGDVVVEVVDPVEGAGEDAPGGRVERGAQVESPRPRRQEQPDESDGPPPRHGADANMRPRMTRQRYALALWLAAVAWVFSGPLFAGRVLYYRDVSVTYYPDMVFAARALARGLWPLWHPGADGGAPFLLAYPVHLLLLAAAGARATLALSPPLHVLRRHGGDGRARPAARHLSGRGCFRRGLLRALGPDARLGPVSRVSRGGVGAPGDRALPRPRRGAERPPRGAPRAGAGGPGVDARRRGGAGDGPLRDRPPGALARSSRRARGRVGRAPGGLPRRPRPPRSGGTPPRHLARRGLRPSGEPRILGAPARAARGGAAALPREPARILRCRLLGPALLPERLAVRPEPVPRPGRAPAGLPRRRRRAEAVAPRGPGRSAGARGARAGRAPDGGPPGHAAPPGQALRPDEPRGRAAGRAGARPRPRGARPPPLPGLRPGPPPPGGRPRGLPRAGRRLGRVSPS